MKRKFRRGQKRSARRTKQIKRIKKKEHQIFFQEIRNIFYHISDAVIEPDDKGEEDEEEGDCVLVRHCKACKPVN